ncbi:putative biotin synthetase like protein [Legionella steigerwaltii]|uniref:Biotin synthetase like protein n=1 Tax=Legionella steigerwaltii TaxID=460 RepID=A0A378L5P8_9GAMM|nr:URC4/urg3 family protein [Legionella steigerwaltii]KTD78116.1 putative biotin synthetase like protein [Legionella steigerwaltii]STY22146.1 putative biotin synthetase like protein [Legionella steigerwaltii]
MSNQQQEIAQVLATLKDPRTIRLRAQAILERVKHDQSAYFSLDPEKMTRTASFVIEVIQDHYPNLDIPYHSRWRHFEAGGINRIKKMLEQLGDLSAAEHGKILYELVIISVFLDAGAGQYWRYKESETGIEYSRSEGLALASLSLYQEGVFSAYPNEPLRVDAERLLNFNEDDLRRGFQVTANNPLEGLSGRVALLNRLGALMQQDENHFGKENRLGNFYSYISSLAVNNTLTASQIFHEVLNAFNDIWPARLLFHGVSLGDVWRYNALKTTEPGSEYIPFHKLSQWLTYSLIEPLEQAGITVTHLEELTGLPEYRNGGLLIDCEVLHVKNKKILETELPPDSEIIVEWRALTIALLDELADLIRKKLKKNAIELPLAKILQGGTWEAGRRVAKQKRSQGTPPIQIISDGTVF